MNPMTRPASPRELSTFILYLEEIPLVQSLPFTDVIVMTSMGGRTYTYLHGDITTVSEANIDLRW